MTRVAIPNTVTSIGKNAFYKCYALTRVTIGTSVTSIGNNAFYNCENLTKVRMLSSTPPSLGSNVFWGTPSSKKIEIPCGSLSAYQQAWGTNYNYVEYYPSFTLTVQSNNTDWQLNDASRMEWNPEYRTYTLRLLLKQGYYAYQLLYLPAGSTVGDTGLLEGDHSETPNRYHIYIYCRQPGERYDRLIAVR